MTADIHYLPSAYLPPYQEIPAPQPVAIVSIKLLDDGNMHVCYEGVNVMEVVYLVEQAKLMIMGVMK